MPSRPDTPGPTLAEMRRAAPWLWMWCLNVHCRRKRSSGLRRDACNSLAGTFKRKCSAKDIRHGRLRHHIELKAQMHTLDLPRAQRPPVNLSAMPGCQQLASCAVINSLKATPLCGHAASLLLGDGPRNYVEPISRIRGQFA